MTHQLTLFAPPAAPVRRYGMPPDVARRWNLAFSDDVKAEIVAVAGARRGEWLGWDAFRPIIDKHQIGFCLGHVLCQLVTQGRLEEQKVYFGKGIGAEKPGSPNYQGYGHLWRAT